MEVLFTPEQEADLRRIATASGTDAEHLVQEAALRILSEKTLQAAVPELPVLHLGPMRPMHRRDIYVDIP